MYKHGEKKQNLLKTEIVSLKERNISNFFKNLDYRKNSSQLTKLSQF
jgi:hypothetical protein